MLDAHVLQHFHCDDHDQAQRQRAIREQRPGSCPVRISRRGAAAGDKHTEAGPIEAELIARQLRPMLSKITDMAPKAISGRGCLRNFGGPSPVERPEHEDENHGTEQ